MPRKLNTKKKKPAFHNAKEEKNKTTCLYVPDHNLDTLKKWTKSCKKVLEKKLSEKVLATDSMSTKDTFNTTLRNNPLKQFNDNTKSELLDCSTENLRDEKSHDNYNIQDECLNLSTCNSETAQNSLLTYSKHLSAKYNNVAQSEKEEEYKIEIASQVNLSTQVGILSEENESETITKSVEPLANVKIGENDIDSDLLHNESEAYVENTQNEGQYQEQNEDEDIPDDNFENKPYDLSIKSKFKNGLDLNVSQVQHDLKLASDECSLNNNQDDSQLEKNDTEEKSDHQQSEISEITPQQRLLLVHLSKIQQNFVSNLIQYQARFLAHYQQVRLFFFYKCTIYIIFTYFIIRFEFIFSFIK